MTNSVPDADAVADIHRLTNDLAQCQHDTEDLREMLAMTDLQLTTVNDNHAAVVENLGNLEHTCRHTKLSLIAVRAMARQAATLVHAMAKGNEFVAEECDQIISAIEQYADVALRDLRRATDES